jgi:hypothetical protein
MADEKTLFERIAELTVAARKIGTGLKKLGDPDELMGRLDSLEGKVLSFREYTERKASITYPFTYIAQIALPAGATNRVIGNITISQKGWFFAERIFASWLPTTDIGGFGTANMWAPLARSNPYIAGAGAIALAEVYNQLNFFFEYVDGRTQQARQNIPIPGDILYRTDHDGYILPGGDAFGPNANIAVAITPTVAPTNHGVLSVAFNGKQCHDVLPQ